MSRVSEPGTAAGEPAVMSARAALEWRCQHAGRPLPQLPEPVVLTHQRSLLGRRRPWARSTGTDCVSFDYRDLGSSERPIGIAACRGVGAPVTAVALEELAVTGVKRVLLIDIAGSIDASVPSGAVVVAEAALAHDGTSPHYTNAVSVRADVTLSSHVASTLEHHGIACARGTVWSTDAVYRETSTQIEDARREGAVLADMETAALLAVAGALDMRAAAVLVAADELYAGWRPPRDMASIQARLKQVLTLAPVLLPP